MNKIKNYQKNKLEKEIFYLIFCGEKLIKYEQDPLFVQWRMVD